MGVSGAEGHRQPGTTLCGVGRASRFNGAAVHQPVSGVMTAESGDYQGFRTKNPLFADFSYADLPLSVKSVLRF